MNDTFKILHVDGDNFFASCEIARRPDLRGKPVVVGEDRGIACAMSREAKKLGITRATPIFEIRKNFPEVTIFASHFELYEAYSEKLFRILSDYLGIVEWYSIDECFAVVPESFMKRYGSWESCLAFLKTTIQSQTGITYSFGLADTKVLAKIASKLEKPDGCVLLTEHNREDALIKTRIESVWGVGWKTSEKLQRMGIATAYDFTNYSKENIVRYFSEPIVAIWHELQGARIHRVHTDHGSRKSIQATRSFSPASDDLHFVYSELSRNIETACARLRRDGLATKHFSVFLKSKSISRKFTSMQLELPHMTQNPSDILQSVRKHYSKLFDKRFRYKSTGITLYDLIDINKAPRDLFGQNDIKREHDRYLDTIDHIRERFGPGSIMLGSSKQSATRRAKEQCARDLKDPYIYRLPLPYLGEVI